MGFPLRYEIAGCLHYLIPRELLRERSVLVVFTTRKGGVSRPPYGTLNLGLHVGDDADAVVANRGALCRTFGLDALRLTCAEQVHGAAIAAVGPEDVGRGATDGGAAIPGADALVCRMGGVPLVVFVADCVPIVLVEPDLRVAAVIHAGRQGTYDRLAHKAIDELRGGWGCRPEALLAFLGPSIRGCCYDVGPELASRFEARFTADEDWLSDTKIDLLELNRRQLAEAGLRPENISSSELCTSCRCDLFFSHRAERGVTGRQAAVVALG